MEGKALGDGEEGAGGDVAQEGGGIEAEKVPNPQKFPENATLCHVSGPEHHECPKVRLFPTCIPWASSAELSPGLQRGDKGSYKVGTGLCLPVGLTGHPR